MKTAIIYSTLTGNAKKLAEAVMKEITGAEMFDLKGLEYSSISSYDLLIFCYWCKRGGADPLTTEFSEKVSGKKVISLGTMGAYPSGEYYEMVLENLANLFSEKNEYLGGYLCQGAINPVLTERRKTAPKDQHTANENWLQMHLDSRSHPDGNDLEYAREFVKKIILNIS